MTLSRQEVSNSLEETPQESEGGMTEPAAGPWIAKMVPLKKESGDSISFCLLPVSRAHPLTRRSPSVRPVSKRDIRQAIESVGDGDCVEVRNDEASNVSVKIAPKAQGNHQGDAYAEDRRRDIMEWKRNYDHLCIEAWHLWSLLVSGERDMVQAKREHTVNREYITDLVEYLEKETEEISGGRDSPFHSLDR